MIGVSRVPDYPLELPPCLPHRFDILPVCHNCCNNFCTCDNSFKSAQIRSLENENRYLKQENSRLTMELSYERIRK